jgi:hypothetical protein
MQKIKTILFIILLGFVLTTLSHNIRGLAFPELQSQNFKGFGLPFAYEGEVSTSPPECRNKQTWSQNCYNYQPKEIFETSYFIVDIFFWALISALVLLIAGKLAKKSFFSVLDLKISHIVAAAILSIVIIAAGTFIPRIPSVPKPYVSYNFDYSCCPVCDSLSGISCAPCGCFMAHPIHNYVFLAANIVFYFPIFLMLIGLSVPALKKFKWKKPTENEPLPPPPAPPTAP